MKVLIEADDSLVFCINNDGHPSDLPCAQTTIQGVHKNELAVTFSALILMNGEAAQKDRGYEWISR